MESREYSHFIFKGSGKKGPVYQLSSFTATRLLFRDLNTKILSSHRCSRFNMNGINFDSANDKVRTEYMMNKCEKVS